MRAPSTDRWPLSRQCATDPGRASRPAPRAGGGRPARVRGRVRSFDGLHAEVADRLAEVLCALGVVTRLALLLALVALLLAALALASPGGWSGAARLLQQGVAGRLGSHGLRRWVVARPCRRLQGDHRPEASIVVLRFIVSSPDFERWLSQSFVSRGPDPGPPRADSSCLAWMQATPHALASTLAPALHRRNARGGHCRPGGANICGHEASAHRGRRARRRLRVEGVARGGHSVDTRADGAEGLTLALSSGYDVIVADRMLRTWTASRSCRRCARRASGRRSSS